MTTYKVYCVFLFFKTSMNSIPKFVIAMFYDKNIVLS